MRSKNSPQKSILIQFLLTGSLIFIDKKNKVSVIN